MLFRDIYTFGDKTLILFTKSLILIKKMLNIKLPEISLIISVSPTLTIISFFLPFDVPDRPAIL